MKTWVRKTLSAGVLAAGALLLAPAAAHADVSQGTSDNVGLGNGTQVFAPIAVPLNVVGNAIGVAGEANSAGAGLNFVESGQHRRHGKGVKQRSSRNVGLANGTQAYLPVAVPLNVVGNSAALLGAADAAGAGVNRLESGRAEHGVDQRSHHNYGALNGTQVYSPIDVPINLCGNALSILGLAQSQAACVNGGGHRTESVKQRTSANYGLANGGQVYAPVSVPLNVAGNAIGVAGEANSAAAARNESSRGRDFSQKSKRNVGALNGNQLAAPINIPINVCGNSLAVLGLADSAAACANDVGGDRSNGGHHHGDHAGNDGDRGGRDGYPDRDDIAGDQGHQADPGDPGDQGDQGDPGDQGGDPGSQGDPGNKGSRDDRGGYDDKDDTAGGQGDQDYGKPARQRHAATTEAGPADSLTQNLSNAGGLNLGSLNILDPLTK